MSVKKTKVEKVEPKEIIDNGESKEEKVAKITSKSLLTSNITTAIISLLLSPILLEYIKKPAPTPNLESDRLVSYFQDAVNQSNEEFDQNKIELNKLNAQIDSEISNESDDELKAAQIAFRENLDNEIRNSEINKECFNTNSKQNFEALKIGNQEAAALHRRRANECVAKENYAIQGRKKQIEKDKVLSAINNCYNKSRCSKADIDLLDKHVAGLGSRLKRDPLEDLERLIRGINDADPKKTMDEITQTYAENEGAEDTDFRNYPVVAAVAP